MDLNDLDFAVFYRFLHFFAILYRFLPFYVVLGSFLQFLAVFFRFLKFFTVSVICSFFAVQGLGFRA